MLKKSNIVSSFFLRLCVLFTVLTLLSSCSDSEKKSSSSGEIGDTFEGGLSGSTATEASANKNTITVSWVHPVHDTIQSDDLDVEVYVSTENNLTTLSDTLANGFNIDSTGSSDETFTIRGFVNSTTYYITLVLYNGENDEVIAAFKPTSVETGIGPVLTSFSAAPGTPVALGTGLNADIWSGSNPAYSYIEDGVDCNMPDSSGLANVTYYFGSNGRTDNGWNPGTGDLSYLVGKCIALCKDFESNDPQSFCTNHVLATGL